MKLYKIIAMTAATTLLTGCVSVTDPGQLSPTNRNPVAGLLRMRFWLDRNRCFNEVEPIRWQQLRRAAHKLGFAAPLYGGAQLSPS